MELTDVVMEDWKNQALDNYKALVVASDLIDQMAEAIKAAAVDGIHSLEWWDDWASPALVKWAAWKAGR